MVGLHATLAVLAVSSDASTCIHPCPEPQAMPESKRFAGLSVLVTGASSGIGRACALALGAEGAHVALAGRRRARLEEVAATVERSGGRTLLLEGDVRDEATCARWAQACEQAFGGLDGLVNAAGVIGNGAIDATASE